MYYFQCTDFFPKHKNLLLTFQCPRIHSQENQRALLTFAVIMVILLPSPEESYLIVLSTEEEKTTAISECSRKKGINHKSK